MSIREAMDWYQSLEDDVGYKIEKNKNAFAVLLNTLLMEQGISKTQLAHRIHKSAPYVTKVLRGDENLTIASMTKLLDAIDCELHINGCRDDQDMKWFRAIGGSELTENKIAQLDPERSNLSKAWAEMAHARKVA